MQCKHCTHEMKTFEETSFWDRVCKICGRILDIETSKVEHQNKHDVEVPDCKVCDDKFTTIYNLHRHMLEQHDSFQGDDVSQRTTNESFVCLVCESTFKYQRNLDTHISITHMKKHDRQCQICHQKVATKSKLKRHITEVHSVTQFDNSIHSEEAKKFQCVGCESVF